MLHPISPRPGTEEKEGNTESKKRLQFLTRVGQAWNGERKDEVRRWKEQNRTEFFRIWKWNRTLTKGSQQV